MLRLPNAVLTILLAASLAACSGDDVELTVMSFNIELGGDKVSFANVVEAIRASGADVVGIQEAEGNLARIADELGWHYDLRNYVISRYPVYEPPGANGRYVFVEVRPGEVVALANVHLPSDPYGPDGVRDGASPEEVLQVEKATRLAAIEPYLGVLPPLADRGIPVIMTGDFNSPSHADWVESTVHRRPFLLYPLAWPVSIAISEAGFRDAWREVYPDPVAHPGITWWAARPPLALYAPGENDARDRIDMIWFAGPAAPLHSLLLGKEGEEEVAIGFDPWPSDHRAVASQFAVDPAPIPSLVTTVKRVHRSGETIDIVYRTESTGRLSLPPLLSESVTGAGRLAVPSEKLAPGPHTISLDIPGEATQLERQIWVLATEARPELEVLDEAYTVGEGIRLRWANGPGNRNDYIAIYAPGEAATYDGGAAFVYVGALPAGTHTLDADSAGSGWPLSAGRYVARLMEDDGDQVLAESETFDVTEDAKPLRLPAGVTTVADGRLPIEELFAAYRTLLARGWRAEVIHASQPAGTDVALPIVALRSPHAGDALWILAGIHGEEPAGPNAIAQGIESIAALGERHPVVLLPLLNPHGYVRNWRYLNTPVYSEEVDGQSVGDSSHLLPDTGDPTRPRAAVSSSEADAITEYIVTTAKSYPPRYSIDLHEDNLIDKGYVYSQGVDGAEDALALLAVEILRANDIPIKMSGETRFGEPISGGIIGPVTDSSIDELMSSAGIICDGRNAPGPAARTVLVLETPAAEFTLQQRVAAHRALVERLAAVIVED